MSVDMDSIDMLLLDTSSEEESDDVGSQDLEGLKKKLAVASKRAERALAKHGGTDNGMSGNDSAGSHASGKPSLKPSSDRSTRLSVMSTTGRSVASPIGKGPPTIKIPIASPGTRNPKVLAGSPDGSDSTDDLSKIIQRKAQAKAELKSTDPSNSTSSSGSSGSSSHPSSTDSASKAKKNSSKSPKSPAFVSPNTPRSETGLSSEHRQVSFDSEGEEEEEEEEDSESYESYETDDDEDEDEELDDEESFETDSSAPDDELPDIVVPLPPNDGQIHKFELQGDVVVERPPSDPSEAESMSLRGSPSGSSAGENEDRERISPSRSSRKSQPGIIGNPFAVNELVSPRTSRNSNAAVKERQSPRGGNRSSHSQVRELVSPRGGQERQSPRGTSRILHSYVREIASPRKRRSKSSVEDEDFVPPDEASRTSESYVAEEQWIGNEYKEEYVSPRRAKRKPYSNAFEEGPVHVERASPRRTSKKPYSNGSQQRRSPVDMELAPPRGTRRKPFSNIPSGIAVEKKSIRPVTGGRHNRAEVGDHARQRNGYGRSNAARRTNDVSRTRVPDKRRGLFERLFGPGAPKKPTRRWIQDDGESYGGAVWEPRRYNDEISEISDPLKARQRERRRGLPDSPASASEFVQPGSRALQRKSNLPTLEETKVLEEVRAMDDMDPLSTTALSVTSDIRMLDAIRKQKRNSRFALAGLPPSSTRKYDSSQGRVLKTVPRDLQPPTANREIPYAADHEVDAGSRMSKKSTETTLMHRLASQQEHIMSLLKQLSSPKQDQPKESIQYQNESLNTVDEEGADKSIAGPMPAYIPEEETFEKDGIESVGTPLPRLPFDDYSKITQDTFWGERSVKFCLAAFLAVGLLVIGFWVLIDVVILDDSRSLPLDSPTPFPPQTRAPSQTKVPTPSPVAAPVPAPTRKPAGPGTPPSPKPTMPVGTTKPTASRDRVESLVLKVVADKQSLSDPDTAQYKAVDWISADSNLPSYDDERVLIRFTLAMFYYSTEGENWGFNDGWLSYTDECTWYSAVDSPCDAESRRFTKLALGDNDIGGSLPADLAILSGFLTAIDLGGTITGSLPSQYGAMTMLQDVRICGKTIRRQIPSEFGKMTSLKNLDLSRNQLNGTIPVSILQDLESLERLDLHDNQLVGSLPSAISNLGRLQELTLRENDLAGAIPSAIGSLTNLMILDLDDNRFSSLPPNLGQLLNLRILSLSNNALGGTLPSSLGNLQSLISLRLNTNALTGIIPSEIGLITGLNDLILRDNRLNGTISPSLGGIRTLFTLRLDENELTGSIPSSVCQSFDMAGSTFYADCGDRSGGNIEIECPCCNFCCSGETGDCFCQFEESNPILCIP